MEEMKEISSWLMGQSVVNKFPMSMQVTELRMTALAPEAGLSTFTYL